MDGRPDPIRIFVSSPGDVWPERGACLRAIALLNGRYKDQLTLEGAFWEEQFFPANTDFQSWIDRQIPPWSCQLVICVLWSRIGSPLSAAWPTRPDGTRYESGTVAEFEMSRDRALRDQTPDLYMFLKRAPLPGGDTADALERTAEAKRVVEQFVHRWFHQPEPVETPGAGAVHPFTAGFNSFTSTDAFEEGIVTFIEWWLREKGWIDRPRTWDVHSQGLPYVGLAPFDLHHAAVFFGRDAERRRARRLLTEADAAGLPYLLIAGGSGVGKSSLARAGLVADLCVDTPQEVWADAILMAGTDPLANLARALLADDGALRPHLAAAHFDTLEKLAAALAAPAVAVTVLPGALDALSQARARERGWSTAPLGRLLLVLDQLESLADASPANQRATLDLLAALAATRRVWIVATVRSDRQSSLLAQAPPPPMAPLLTGLLRPDGAAAPELKLTPPDEAAMRDIIEAPARAAGLSFEEGSDAHSLPDELRAAMAGNPDALPLMQALLHRMFAADIRQASWADYERLGRLDGAIADAADAAIGTLSDAARAELRPLLLTLTADVGVDGSATARAADRAAFTTSPARADLVAALVGARLLAVDEADRMRVAHEAVLRTWPRARELLAGAAAFIRLRERLRRSWDDWRSGGGALLPAGPLLSEAALSLPALDAETDTAPLAAFVRAGLLAERRARQRRTTVWSGVTVALALFAGVSVFFAVAASRAARDSDSQRQVADTMRAQADANAALAQRRQTEAEAERAEADRQRKAATDAAAQSERNLDAAMSAVETLVFDLARDLRNRSGMPTDMVRTILALSDRAIDGLERAAPGDARVQRFRLVALADTARTLLTAGDGPGARRSAARAVAVAEELAAAKPDDTERQRDLYLCYGRYGDVLLGGGEAGSAIVFYRKGLDIRERLAASHPDDPEWQRALAIGLSQIGDVLASHSEGPAALDAYRKSQAISERLAPRFPDNLEWQRDLSVISDRIGDMLRAQGDNTGALSNYRKGLAIAEGLAQHDPKNTEWQRDVSVSHERIGEILRIQGDTTGALASYRQGLAIREALVRQDPLNSAMQHDLSISDERIGLVLQDSNDLPGALDALTKSLGIRELLAAQDPSNTDWQRDVIIAHNRVGDLLLIRKDPAGALAAFGKGLAIVERLVALDATNAEWQRDLSISHDRMGEALLQSADLPGALAQYQSSLAGREQLAEQDPGNGDRQRGVLVSQNKIGDILRAQSDRAGALAAYRRGLAIAERLVATDSGNTAWQRDLSISLERIGGVLEDGKDYPGASAAYGRAVAIHERLAAMDPDNADWQRDLAVTLNEQAGPMEAADDQVSAAAAYRRALAITRHLVTLNASNATWHADLVWTREHLGGLSGTLIMHHHPAEALAAATDALPGDPPLLWIDLNRAHALMLLGRLDEARAIYLGHHGENPADGQHATWEDAVRADFAELRTAGITTPLMDDVAAAMAEP